MAQNNYFLQQLTTPNLQANDFAEKFSDLVDNINKNFQAIVRSPYLQGKPGKNISNKKEKILEDGNFTAFGKAVMDAIFGSVISSTSYNTPAEFKLLFDALNEWTGNNTYPISHITDATEVDVFYNETTEEEVVASIYVFTDARINILSDYSVGQKFTDYSCAIYGSYYDGQWHLIRSGVMPTLYYDDEKFCWIINGQKTGISAQGLRGESGSNPIISILGGTMDGQATSSSVTITANEVLSSTIGTSSLDDLDNTLVFMWYDKDGVSWSSISEASNLVLGVGILGSDGTNHKITINPNYLDFSQALKNIHLQGLLESVVQAPEEEEFQLRMLFIPTNQATSVFGALTVGENELHIGKTLKANVANPDFNTSQDFTQQNTSINFHTTSLTNTGTISAPQLNGTEVISNNDEDSQGTMLKPDGLYIYDNREDIPAEDGVISTKLREISLPNGKTITEYAQTLEEDFISGQTPRLGIVFFPQKATSGAFQTPNGNDLFIRLPQLGWVINDVEAASNTLIPTPSKTALIDPIQLRDENGRDYLRLVWNGDISGGWRFENGGTNMNFILTCFNAPSYNSFYLPEGGLSFKCSCKVTHNNQFALTITSKLLGIPTPPNNYYVESTYKFAINGIFKDYDATFLLDTIGCTCSSCWENLNLAGRFYSRWAAPIYWYNTASEIYYRMGGLSFNWTRFVKETPRSDAPETPYTESNITLPANNKVTIKSKQLRFYSLNANDLRGPDVRTDELYIVEHKNWLDDEGGVKCNIDITSPS